MSSAPPTSSTYTAYTSKQTLIRELVQAAHGNPIVLEIAYKINRSNLASGAVTDGATIYGSEGFWAAAE